jgi:hypothetical protein
MLKFSEHASQNRSRNVIRIVVHAFYSNASGAGDDSGTMLLLGKLMGPLFEESVFQPAEATILTQAYYQSVSDVEAEYVLDDQAKSKLGKIVLAIGHNWISSGDGLTSDDDAGTIASMAIERFLRLRAG